MSDGSYVEGSCKACGEWTKGIDYQYDGLCLVCATKKREAMENMDKFSKAVYDDFRFNKVVDKHFWELFDEVDETMKPITKRSMQDVLNGLRIFSMCNVIDMYAEFGSIGIVLEDEISDVESKALKSLGWHEVSECEWEILVQKQF
jgi:hypothetical protein